MASVPLLTKPAGNRPPFDGGPPLTTFAPDPDEQPDYLVDRARKHVEALESYSRKQDVDPDTVLELLNEVSQWIENLLRLERALTPSLLPPGVGTLYSIDFLLEAESDTVASYKRLLDRLEIIRPTIEGEARLKHIIGMRFELE